MKKSSTRLAYICAMLCLLATSCNKQSSNSWDNTAAAELNERRALWGGNDDLPKNSLAGPTDEDFIPLQEEDLKSQFADGAIPQPKHFPGEAGSGLPSIDRFYKPTAHLATIFRNVYFNTDDHILRGKDSLMILDKMANYLKGHTDTYVSIEGHCDERGPEAYNLSLGARRANYVRSQLVQKGVNPNQIHTVSYGKERPAEQGHSPNAWTKNRRAEFKLYEIK